MRNRKYRPNYE